MDTTRVNIIRIIMLLGFLFMGIQGCMVPSRSAKSEDPIVASNSIDLNGYLAISVIGTLPLRQGESINLYIENISPSCIVFPKDYGVRMFVNRNGNWMEVPNTVVYEGPETITLETKVNALSHYDGGTSVEPDLSTLNSQIGSLRLRVYSVGQLCSNDIVSEKEVGGYIDLDIAP
jgi:hypothetical protein